MFLHASWYLHVKSTHKKKSYIFNLYIEHLEKKIVCTYPYIGTKFSVLFWHYNNYSNFVPVLFELCVCVCVWEGGESIVNTAPSGVWGHAPVPLGARRLVVESF